MRRRFVFHALTDIQEAIKTIFLANGLSFEEFDAIREAKANDHGGFSKWLFLESVDEGDDPLFRSTNSPLGFRVLW